MIKPVCQTLLTPKVNRIPRGLIYRVPTEDIYNLVETKTGRFIGKMCAFVVDNKNNIYDVSVDAKTYRVYSLEIEESEQNKGWGTYFMDFAKRQSYREGCEGRLYLVAYNSISVPQIFYKKQGLLAVDKSVDKKLDNCIKNHICPMWHAACEMYLPLNKPVEKQKVVEKQSFWGFIKSFLGIENN